MTMITKTPGTFTFMVGTTTIMNAGMGLAFSVVARRGNLGRSRGALSRSESAGLSAAERRRSSSRSAESCVTACGSAS
jgi:hypothetical protein